MSFFISSAYLHSFSVCNLVPQFFKKTHTQNEVKVGTSESMSKSKKNTIDPENIISFYGADAVRLFILSDSPPEKDVQWS